MSKKSFARSQTDIQRFRKANKAKKRVLIAQDVIAQLNSKRFVATEGVWVEKIDGLEDELVREDGKSTEICDLLANQSTCEVCGLGALFVSCVEFADKLNVRNLDEDQIDTLYQGGGGMSFKVLFPYLNKYFAGDQLVLIEIAFEHGLGNFSSSHHIDGQVARDFFNHIDASDMGDEEYAELRMRLIMENIVANRGTFDVYSEPIVRTVYVTPGYEG